MVLSVVLLFFDFGARVLVTNDETRFPVMARDILAHGHWLRPEINGSRWRSCTSS
jgi:4-amino-4-deoxy-L-arabinose transferase-like glycosyltransferase